MNISASEAAALYFSQCAAFTYSTFHFTFLHYITVTEVKYCISLWIIMKVNSTFLKHPIYIKRQSEKQSFCPLSHMRAVNVNYLQC